MKNAVDCSFPATMTVDPNPERTKILRAERRRRHRYDRYRALSQAFTLAALLLVPISGLARVDLWHSQHRLLFESVPLRLALVGVIFAIAAFYVLTFLINLAAGRLFCGWGCPIAQVNRFAETASGATTRRRRLRAVVSGAFYSAAVVVGVLSWWTDLRVLILGSPTQLSISWGVVVAGTAAAFAQGRFVRWAFCQQACPIGLYYTLVAPARWFGVQFSDTASRCIDCGVCDEVCPVGLTPRELATTVPMRGGLSLSDVPGRNLCLECGDCVRGCEMVLRKHGAATIPLKLGYVGGQPGEPMSPEVHKSDLVTQARVLAAPGVDC